MTNFTPDIALNTFLGGRFGTPNQGIVTPGWARNPVLDVTLNPAPLDFETSVLCNPANTPPTPVLIVSSISQTGLPVSIGYNVDGTVFVGALNTLVGCGGASLESDPITMCDSTPGTTFLRWVVTDSGQPTGVVFNTTLTGAAYVPVGAVVVGACGSGCEPSTAAGVLTTWG